VNPPRWPSGADDVEVAPKGYELIGGALVEKKTGCEAAWVAGKVLFVLERHCDRRHLGWVVSGNAGYRCFEPWTVRKPDASFVRSDRMPRLPRGNVTIPPDLIVEVVAPGETVYEVDAKAEAFLSVGTRLIWVVNPASRTVLVHRPDGTVTKLRDGASLGGEEVIDGFSCAVAAFLPPVPAAG
jgi:Uma2 family endonuclease